MLITPFFFSSYSMLLEILCHQLEAELQISHTIIFSVFPRKTVWNWIYIFEAKHSGSNKLECSEVSPDFGDEFSFKKTFGFHGNKIVTIYYCAGKVQQSNFN